MFCISMIFVSLYSIIYPNVFHIYSDIFTNRIQAESNVILVVLFDLELGSDNA